MPERFGIYIVYERRYINTLPFPVTAASSTTENLRMCCRRSQLLILAMTLVRRWPAPSLIAFFWSGSAKPSACRARVQRRGRGPTWVRPASRKPVASCSLCDASLSVCMVVALMTLLRLLCDAVLCVNYFSLAFYSCKSCVYLEEN